jgi:hypothetical protein
VEVNLRVDDEKSNLGHGCFLGTTCLPDD